MNATILVLTATGTTGSATVAALHRRGASVRAATRDPSKASFPEGVEAVRWDYDAPETWAPALAGVDALYFANPAFRADEVALGQAILAAAKAAGVRRIVKLSAIGVENSPESGHRQVELAIEASGLQWVHLRPNFFFENFIEFYGGSIAQEGAIYLPAGEGRTSFVGAADIGEAAATALLGAAHGEAWTLTGGEALDHAEVAMALSGVLGRPIRYIDIPPAAFEEALRGYGSGEVAVQTMSALYGFVRAGWTGGVAPDLARVLGRAPQTFAAWAAQNPGAWGGAPVTA